jgi:hypothetical protein
MASETHRLTSPSDRSFYGTNNRLSASETGATGSARRILHGLTIISVLVATGCSIYGLVQSQSGLIVLPFAVVLVWCFIHIVLLIFLRRAKDDFHPPGWFVFVSGGHIFIQSLVAIILTLFKQ